MRQPSLLIGSASVTGASWLTCAALLGAVAFAQQYPPQPTQQYPAYGQTAPPYYGAAPSFSPRELDDLVARVALYSDPLLAEVLTASTFPDQIQQAAWWSHQHRYLYGDGLARAIAMDRLPYDPSVLGLIPFPMVLDMLAMDTGWTQQLGAAVLADRSDVMDAVQRMRQRAWDAGYLRDSPEQRVIARGPGWIEIVPASPGYYYVPTYNPAVVFYRPARGVSIGLGISFGPRIYIGANFASYGWAGPSLDWRAHTVIIDRRPWTRTWANRGQYQHYQSPRSAGPGVERHEKEIHQRERHDDRHDRGRDHDR